MRLFIINVYGLFGGGWFCAAYGKTAEEAHEIAMEVYPINENTWEQYEQSGLNLDVGGPAITELVFNDSYVSNLWWGSW